MTSHDLADPPGTDACERERHRRVDARRDLERQHRASLHVLALAPAIILVLFWPGLISYDANSTIYEAEVGPATGGRRSCRCSGAMLLVADTWLLFVVQTLLVVVGVFLCTLRAPASPAAIATLLICVYPPLYAQLSGPSRRLLPRLHPPVPRLPVHGGQGLEARTVRRPVHHVRDPVVLVPAERGHRSPPRLCAGRSRLSRRDLAPEPMATRLAAPRRSWLSSSPAWPSWPCSGTRAALAALGVVETRPERQIFIYDLVAMSVELDDDLFPSELDRRPHGVVPLDDSSRRWSGRSARRASCPCTPTATGTWRPPRRGTLGQRVLGPSGGLVGRGSQSAGRVRGDPRATPADPARLRRQTDRRIPRDGRTDQLSVALAPFLVATSPPATTSTCSSARRRPFPSMSRGHT